MDLLVFLALFGVAALLCLVSLGVALLVGHWLREMSQ